MKSALSRIAVFVFLCVTALGAAKADSIGVETTLAEPVKLAQTINAVGTLSAENSVVIRPEISGRIAELNFEEGGKAEKGQVLIQLDNAIESAEYKQAQASLNLARSQHHRAQQLSKQGFISSQAHDEAVSQLQVQQAAVALAQAQLEKTKIVAPFDGLLGLRHVSVGGYVSPGQDLVSLDSIDPLNVDFRVPEQFLPQVQVGTRIVLSFDALPGETRDGFVGAINPSVEVGGRSVLLRAKVPNTDSTLRPGMFARVQLKFQDHDALMVPESAIAPAGDATYVYKVENSIATKLAVTLGIRRDGYVEIVHGLNPNDEIIVSGLQKVSDGSKVHVLQRMQNN